MKLSIKGFLIISVIALLASCCNKNSVKPDYPQYSYTSNIVNPPDYFRVNYNVSFAGNKTASITFDTNSVWAIKKLGDIRILFSASNGTDKLTIVSVDTLGLTGGKAYEFTANNNASLDLTSYIVEFTRIDTDYAAFEPKF